MSDNSIKALMLERREKSARIFKRYTDSNLQYSTLSLDDNALAKLVIKYFEAESELCYPAKYIFCNIVYAYYAEKYFKLPFYEALQWPELLANSPNEYLYKEHQQVYDAIIEKVLPCIEKYEKAIKKTRLYFKQEFCIYDEDLTPVIF